MPFFYDHGHYAAIVSLLRAGDVQSSVRTNGDDRSIEVHLTNHSVVLWSNALEENKPVWRCSIISKEGVVEAYGSNLPHDAMPEQVAHLIATYEYVGTLTTL